MKQMTSAINPQEILQRYFGYADFRAGQGDIIGAIMQGRDCVGIMPTGAGKSVCYQVPAMLMQGVCLVISPLISLMQDQVSALTQSGISAAYINSSLDEREYFSVIDNTRAGVYKILYIAPERLESDNFKNMCASLTIGMVTVDEAHCISQWGQDFRPSYLLIPEFIRGLPVRPVVSAFTATATKQVRDDIVRLLELNEPSVTVTSFDRPNLYFDVKKPKDKYEAVRDFICRNQGKSGVIYCSTRKAVDEVCGKLNEDGFSAAPYHAGMSQEKRKKNQQDFIFDKTQIIVATNAFGMGIDKSNVSFVLHYNMPGNLESYYQEAGRAGRDGSPAHCLLLYSANDVRTNQFFIDNDEDMQYPDKETEKRVKESKNKRLKEMTFYCHTSNCLRQYILRYFGESSGGNCDNCGNCNAGYRLDDITVEAQMILSCVVRAEQRYGAAMIIDILRGSKNKRLLSLGLDKLSTYGICRRSDESLRNIINFLILNDYLALSNDGYNMLRLGQRSAEVLKERKSLQMRVAIESLAENEWDETPDTFLQKSDKSSKKERRNAQKEQEQSVSQFLLEKLKALRTKLAFAQGVPAYVVFANSTLIDMCKKLPKTMKDMMGISGVGEAKLERYGKDFLDEIARAVNESNNPQGESASPPVVSDEDLTVSIIADRLNKHLELIGGDKITALKLGNWLAYRGMLYIEREESGKSYKLPTRSGERLGITAEKREGVDGSYYLNLYNANAQQYIYDNSGDLLEYLGIGE